MFVVVRIRYTVQCVHDLLSCVFQSDVFIIKDSILKSYGSRDSKGNLGNNIILYYNKNLI